MDGAESDDDDDDSPQFSCQVSRSKKFHLHTHAPVKHLLYHLGPSALKGDDFHGKDLSAVGASRWKALQAPKVKKILTPKLVIKVPGGRLPKKWVLILYCHV